MDNTTLKKRLLKKLWEWASVKMWHEGLGKVWMINFIDKLGRNHE